jgi:hypothetical protein
VNVAVEDGLSSGRAAVNPEVESCNRRVAFAKTCPAIFQQALDGIASGCRKAK